MSYAPLNQKKLKNLNACSFAVRRTMSYSPALPIIAYVTRVGYNEAKPAMKKINIRRLIYHIRHNYITLNNIVIVVAFSIAAGWVWGSLGVMQRNYDLQKDLDYKKLELQLAELQTANLELEGRYYKTNEYLELAAREDLGLVSPGESVLILPPNSEAAKAADTVVQAQVSPLVEQEGNITQWTNFLFGANSKKANDE